MPRRCRDSGAVVLPRWCWAGRSPRQICPSIVPWLPPAVFGHRLKCSPGHPVPFLENTVPVSEDFPHSNDSNDDYFHFSLSLSPSLSHLPVDILYYMIIYDFYGEWRRIAHWPGIFVWSFLGHDGEAEFLWCGSTRRPELADKSAPEETDWVWSCLILWPSDFLIFLRTSRNV